MIAGVLLGLALLGQVPPAKLTGAEILIQDRAIELPILPERLQDAKNQYSKLRPRMVTAITSRMVLLTIKRNELQSSDQSDRPWPLFDLLAVDGLDYAAWNSQIQGAVELANNQAPRLAKAWQPLAQHLNAAALKMLEFERSASPTQDSEIRILRLQAKINVLERFRSALWFCQMVWAHMASKPLPSPLRKLW